MMIVTQIIHGQLKPFVCYVLFKVLAMLNKINPWNDETVLQREKFGIFFSRMYHGCYWMNLLFLKKYILFQTFMIVQ